MKQRTLRSENARKPGAASNSRSRTPEINTGNTEAEPPFEHAVTNLRSKLQNLEEKYSYFMKHYATQLHEHRVRKAGATEERKGSEDRGARTKPRDVSPKPAVREPSVDSFLSIQTLIDDTKSRVLRLLPSKTSSLDFDDMRSRVTDEFTKLSSSASESFQRIRWKSEPGQAKEWVRKLLKLEEEKRTLETNYRDYIETLTKRMMTKNDEYQREIAMLQRENAMLLAGTGSHSSKRSIISTASPKSHTATRSMTPDIELQKSQPREARHRFATPDKENRRTGSPIQRSVSPAERKIQGLKNEVDTYKQKLEAAAYEIDLLKAWKNSYTKNPPDYAEIVHAHSSESSYERKQLVTKVMILHHKLNSTLHAVSRFSRLASALTKSSRDRDAILSFENARSDLETILRDIPKEDSSIAPLTVTESQRDDLEEVVRLREDLSAERVKTDTFGEMLGLMQSKIEEMGGGSVSPATFLERQHATIEQLKEQIRKLTDDATTTDALKKENKLLMDKQVVERMTFKRLNEEIEELRCKGTVAQPSNDEHIKKQLKSFMAALNQKFELLVKLLVECLATRNKQIDTAATRLERLKKGFERGKSQLFDSKSSISSLKAALDSQKRENISLQTQSQRYVSDIEELSSRLETLTKTHQSALAAKDMEIKDLNDEIKAGEVDNKALRMELADTMRSLEEMEKISKKMQNVGEKEANLRANLDKKRTKLRAVREESKSVVASEVEKERKRGQELLTASIDEKNRLCEEMKALQSEYQSKFALLESERNRAKIDVSDIEKANKLLEDELKSAKSSLQDAKRMDQQRLEALGNLTTESEEKQILINSLRSGLDGESKEYDRKLDKAKSEFGKSMSEMERKSDALKRENEAFISKIDTLESDVTTLRRLSEQLESDKSRLESCVARLESKLSIAVTRETELKEANSHLSLEVNRLSADSLDLKNQLQSLVSELKTAEKNAEKVSIIDTLQVQISAQGEEIRRLQEREEEGLRDKDRLETVLRDMRKRVNSGEARVAQWRKMIDTVKIALGAYRESLSVLKETVKPLSSECSKVISEIVHRTQLSLLAMSQEKDQYQSVHAAAMRKINSEKTVVENSLESCKKQAEDYAKRAKNDVARLELEIDSTKQGFDSKCAELASLQSQSDKELSKLKELIDILKRQIDEKTAEIDKNRSTICSLEASLSSERQTNSYLKDELQTKDSSLSSRSDSLNQAKQTTISLQSELNEEKAQREKLSQQLSSLKENSAQMMREKQGELEDLESRWQSLAAGSEADKREITALKGKIEVGIEAKEKAIRESERLSKDNERLQGDLDRVNSVVLELQSNISGLKIDIKDKVDAITSLKTSLSRTEITLKETLERVEKLSSECFESTEQRISSEEKVKLLLSQLEIITHEKGEQSVTIASLKSELTTAEEQSDKVRKEKSELDAVYKELLALKETSSKSATDLERLLEEKNRTIEEQKKRMSRLQDDVDNFKFTLESTKFDNMKLQDRVQSSESQVSELTSQLESLQDRVHHLQESLQNESVIVESGKLRISDLEGENHSLKEEIRKLSSEPAFQLTTNSDHDSGPLDIVRDAEMGGENSIEVFAESRIETEEPEVRALNPDEEPSGRDSAIQITELLGLLSGYSAPQEDIVQTVKQLLEELNAYKKSKTGVVIPKLQIPSLHTSQYAQTSPKAALSLSFAPESEGKSEEKSEERVMDVSPERQSKSMIVGGIQDQDTPRSKAFPELWRSRASSELKQHKTEEIYSLHNKIRGLEKDLAEESKIREHLERQTRLLKEEIEEKNRIIRRAQVAETGGEKSPVNVEHLKDLIMKLLMLLPEL